MRPRKVPPVHVPNGHKFCFRCNTVMPLDGFSIDAQKWDSKRVVCRTCDSKAVVARDQRRRVERHMMLAAGIRR